MKYFVSYVVHTHDGLNNYDNCLIAHNGAITIDVIRQWEFHIEATMYNTISDTISDITIINWKRID